MNTGDARKPWYARRLKARYSAAAGVLVVSGWVIAVVSETTQDRLTALALFTAGVGAVIIGLIRSDHA